MLLKAMEIATRNHTRRLDWHDRRLGRCWALDASACSEVGNLSRKQELLCDGVLDELDGSRRRRERLLDLLAPLVLRNFEIVQELEQRRLVASGQPMHQCRSGSELPLDLLPSRDILAAQVAARQSEQACRPF
jgi:hypothetical protein